MGIIKFLYDARQLMDHPDYLAGNYTTKFMEDFKMDPKYKEEH